jgi:hypothetical protein
MYQQLWGYKVEEKLYLGVRKQKTLTTAALQYVDNLVTEQRNINNRSNIPCFKTMKVNEVYFLL